MFCHCDLSQSNIIVNPKTLKIEGIIDWEYAGFWPDFFETPYYRVSKPSGAQFKDEAENAPLVDFLRKHTRSSEETFKWLIGSSDSTRRWILTTLSQLRSPSTYNTFYPVPRGGGIHGLARCPLVGGIKAGGILNYRCVDPYCHRLGIPTRSQICQLRTSCI